MPYVFVCPGATKSRVRQQASLAHPGPESSHAARKFHKPDAGFERQNRLANDECFRCRFPASAEGSWGSLISIWGFVRFLLWPYLLLNSPSNGVWPHTDASTGMAAYIFGGLDMPL